MILIFLWLRNLLFWTNRKIFNKRILSIIIFDLKRHFFFLDKTVSFLSSLDLEIIQNINNPLISNKDPIIEIKKNNEYSKRNLLLLARYVEI